MRRQHVELDDVLFEVFDRTLRDPSLAPAFKEQALQLPAESFLAEQRAMVDPEAVRAARQLVRSEIGRRLQDSLSEFGRGRDFEETLRRHWNPRGRELHAEAQRLIFGDD